MFLYTTTNGCPLIPHLQSIAFPYHVNVYQYGYTYTYNKLETVAQISKTQGKLANQNNNKRVKHKANQNMIEIFKQNNQQFKKIKYEIGLY